MDNISLNAIFGVGGTVLGIVGTITTKFFGGYIERFNKEQERKAKQKLNVAIEVHKICNEASTSNLRVAPRDIEHVNTVMTDVGGVDEEIGEAMNSFVNLWVLVCSGEKRWIDKEKAKNLIEMRSEVEKYREILIKWASKIRTG